MAISVTSSSITYKGFKFKCFTLGLSNLHELTKGRPHRLRIDIGLQNGTRSYANYAIFRVDGPETSYRLHVSNYSGNAGMCTAKCLKVNLDECYFDGK